MLKKTYILLLFIMSLGMSLSAQVAFKRTYGGSGYSKGNSLVQTPDGGYLCVGATSAYGNGTSDVFIFKTDSSGVFQWLKSYGGLNIDVATHITPLSDGNYIVCGYTNSKGNGGYDAYLLKIDIGGDTLWTKTYGGADWDFGNEVYSTPNGSIYIAGQTYSFGKASQGYLVKVAADGTLIYEKNFGGLSDESFSSIAPAFNNTVALAGYTNSYGSGLNDGYILFTDTLGIIIDSLVVGGTKNDELNDILPAPGNGLIAAGYSASYNANANQDIYEVRVDSLNDMLWHAEFGGAVATTVVPSYNSSNYAVAGYSTNISSGNPITAFIWIGTTPPGAWLPNFCPFKNFNTKPDIVNDMIKVPGGWCAIGTTENMSPGLSAAFLLKTNYDLTACSESFVLSVDDTPVFNFNIYPNPTDGSFNITFKQNVKSLDIKVYNAIGQQVFNKAYKNASSVTEDFNQFENGLYFIQLSADGAVGTQRLVIAK